MDKLDKHYITNENVILKCRPARISFLPEYVLTIAVIFIALLLGYYRLTSWLNTQYSLAVTYTILLAITIILAIILLISIDYRIWSKRYAITNQRIMISEGLFKENFKAITYANIVNVDFHQSQIDKILNVGTLTISVVDNERVELMMKHISHPMDIKNKILEQQIQANNSV